MRFRRSLEILWFAVLVAAVASCAATTGSIAPSAASDAPTAIPTVAATTSAAPAPSIPGSVGPFPATGCAIADPAFCAPAAEVAEAIVSGDSAAIVEHSRPDVFRCDELDAAIFTDCSSADVLDGHPIGMAGTIRVFPAPEYGDELEATNSAIDPTFIDGAGNGEARVLGTSSCGPDDPARRSHYIAWTAAITDASGEAERFVGLYEFTFRDDAWLIGILYLDPVTAWEANHPQPLRDVACGVTPWGGG